MQHRYAAICFIRIPPPSPPLWNRWRWCFFLYFLLACRVPGTHPCNPRMNAADGAVLYRGVAALLFFFYPILERMGKIKFMLPHFHVPSTRASIQPVATAAHVDATGCVGMSTRLDLERSGAVEIATRRCPRLRVLARAHILTKTQVIEPSRQTRSS